MSYLWRLLTLAFGGTVVFVLVVGGGQLGLELVHRAASFGDELADVPGHLRELAGAEEDQEQDSDDN